MGDGNSPPTAIGYLSSCTLWLPASTVSESAATSGSPAPTAWSLNDVVGQQFMSDTGRILRPVPVPIDGRTRTSDSRS